MINVFAGGPEAIVRRWSIEGNIFKDNCLSPVTALEGSDQTTFYPMGIQFGSWDVAYDSENRPVNPEKEGKFGLITNCVISKNDFRASGTRPEPMQPASGVVLGWGGPTSPQGCLVYQPEATWPEPNDDPMAYMFDGGEGNTNVFVGHPIKVSKAFRGSLKSGRYAGGGLRSLGRSSNVAGAALTPAASVYEPSPAKRP
jgi:hypothetical protein